MKTTRAFTIGTLVLFSGLVALQAQVSIQLVRTFNYPTQNAGFFTGQINDSDVLVGSVIPTSGVLEGFYAKATGRVSAPFHEPDDTLGFTDASGINNHGIICGRYDDKSFTTKGFVRIGANYYSYVAPVQGNVTGTTINSINDANDFVGEYVVNGSSGGAYANIGGVFTPLAAPGVLPEATGINNLSQIVGVYSDDPISGIYHGYFLDSDATLTSYDFPGATTTSPTAINDAGFIVGSWYDGQATHGFLIQLPSTYISYDVPGGSATQITGINNSGEMCGIYYVHGVGHGFIAQMVTE